MRSAFLAPSRISWRERLITCQLKHRVGISWVHAEGSGPPPQGFKLGTRGLPTRPGLSPLYHEDVRRGHIHVLGQLVATQAEFLPSLPQPATHLWQVSGVP